MTHPAVLATRYARRPLLLEPAAAQTLLNHLTAQDSRGLQREGRFDAFMRRLGVGRARAQDVHDDAYEEGLADAAAAPPRPACYAPLWLQQRYGEPTAEGFAWSLFEGVATMEIATALAERGEYYCGTWYHGYDTVLAGMREALSDARVNGLFVRMSSPGGPVSGGLAQLTSFMRAARASAGGKPIHIYADMACSAGYWCASPGDRITGPNVGLVGSIGAVILHEDWSEGLKKAGVVITPIQFGDQKTGGAWWEALSPEARADLQAEIDQCGRNFVADVTLSRPRLTSEALLATQARVFLGEHDDSDRSGLALGFIDAVRSEEEAFAELLDAATPRKSAPSSGQSSAGATTGSRDAAISPKETPMAAGQTPIGRTSARIAAPRADSNSDAAPDDTMDGGEGEDAVEEEPQSGAAEGSADEKDAIAGSAEAKSHPHLALAAISSGQTLAQFRANVAAAGTGPKVSRLDGLMPSARLAPDAAQAETAQSPINASNIYAKRRDANAGR